MKIAIRKNVVSLASFSLLLASLAAFQVAVAADAYPADLAPGSRYYFDSFNPQSKPWSPGQPLNIEEVFKNYQYVEIVTGDDGKLITVNQYIQGGMRESARYRIMPDGVLVKEE
ncbi:MAG: hypothetical protein WC053_01180 [Sideroxydans sp.]|jgi:hypothetical protein